MKEKTSFPITHFELDLTNHCNLHCEYCFHHSDLEFPKGFMDTELALQIIREVSEKGLSRGVSTAIFGEALLHKDFFHIAQCALDKGLELTLNTNGLPLGSEVAQKVFTLNPTKLFVSLNTPDEENFGLKHAGANISFAEYIEKIKGAIRTKFRLKSPTKIFLYVLNTFFQQPRGLMVINENRAASEAVQFFIELCLPIARDFNLDKRALHKAAAKQNLVARKWPIDRGLELLEGVEIVFKEAHSWGNRMLPTEFTAVPTRKGYCSFPFDSLTVHWNGDCSICCLDYNREIHIGSVLESSIEEIFTGEKITEIRRSMEKGDVTEPLCQMCLGGLRDRNTGRMIRKPMISNRVRWLNSLKKYGLVNTARYIIQSRIKR